MSETERTLRQLNLIRIVAILDFALLVPLVIAALTHAERVVDLPEFVRGSNRVFNSYEVVPIKFDTALMNRVRVTGFDDGANPTIEKQKNGNPHASK